MKFAEASNSDGIWKIAVFCYHYHDVIEALKAQDKYKNWIRKDENEFHVILSYIHEILDMENVDIVENITQIKHDALYAIPV